MSTTSYEGVFDPTIAALIRRKARKLARNRHDREDLQQQLAMEVFAGMRRYDEQRATAAAFAAKIVMSKMLTWLEHRTAQKRDLRREQLAGDCIGLAVDGRSPSRRKVDLITDVRNAVATLPSGLKPIATLFTNHREAGVMRYSGLSRQRVRSARHRIAQHFRLRGLEAAYFPRRATNRRASSVSE